MQVQRSGASLVAAVLVSAVLASTAPAAAAVPVSGKRIVGYFTQWGIYARGYNVRDVDTRGAAERLTHINYAFGDVDPKTLTCRSVDPFADYDKAFDAAGSVDGVADSEAAPVKGNFGQLAKLKKKHPHLKLLISLGGWTRSNHFSTAALPANRKAFVKSCVDMWLKGVFAPGKEMPGLFDGIDIDWEYPGLCGNTCDFRPEDTVNFTALLAEFRKQMEALGKKTKQTYLLTIATGAGEEPSGKMELDKIHASLDFINIMTYDFHGSWEKTANLHSPLYGVPEDPSYALRKWTDNSVSFYRKAGVPAEKIVIGVPFYGRGWGGVPPGPNKDGLYQDSTVIPMGKYEKGVDDYNEMPCRERTFKKFVHPLAKTAYIYNESELWTYDDPATLAGKMEYILSKGLAGAMFWELSGDTAVGDLLSSVYSGLNPTPAP